MRTIRFRRLPRRTFAPGFDVWTLRADAEGGPLDPFLACDLFQMSVPYFLPHPHAGFSAVTYMLPGSPGGFLNRDSLGDRSRIGPGDVHWTEAAAGMLHEEVPDHPGTMARGLQLFVDLPADQKLAPPQVHHCMAGDLPTRPFGDALGRIVADGGLWGHAGVSPRTSCLLLDVEIPPRGIARVPLPEAWRVFGLRYVGALADEPQSITFEPALAFDAESGADSVELEAGVDGARVVLMGGLPLRQPLAFGGPFIMSTAADLTDAKRRYAGGEMGHLEPSFIVPA